MNWLFTDMNSYFASVEQHLRPELRGRNIGVVPVESEGTCVIAASVGAKRFGVKTGTLVRDARLMCPDIILVKARPKLYVQIHHAILRSVDACAPVHKVYSIDEWAVRLIGKERQRDRAVQIGRHIKQKLLEDFGPCLTCSIGIAPTRLLAKIASDLQKPDGLIVLDPSDLPDKLEHLSLNDLCGIGPGMLTRLNANGVQNIRDLWALNKQQSVGVWGSVSGGHWWAGLHGFDEPELPTRRRSMTHASVLGPEHRNEKDAYGILVRLLVRLGARLRHDGYYAQSLQVHVKNLRGPSWHQQVGLPCIHDTPTLLNTLQQLWQARPAGKILPLRVGVDVGGLVLVTQVSQSLFDQIEKPRRVCDAIDKINLRWGAAAVYFGSMHDYRHHMDDKIAFGRIPPVVQ